MKCKEINQPVLLVNYFLQDDEPDKFRVLKCFYELYFDYFKRLTFKFCLNKPYAKYKEEQLAVEAFNDGLLSFYFFIRKNGFANRGATVGTVFIKFCQNKLMGLTTAIYRQSGKYTSGDPEKIIEAKGKTLVEDDLQSLTEDIEQNDKESGIMHKALQLLNPRCFDLIYWRKIDKIRVEEIAKRLNIQPGSVNNEVYKCFIKMKKIVADLREENK